jgi:hypothetical protein
MKFLKTYNESLRDLMTPKSEEEILKSLKGLDNSELLEKSYNYIIQYIPGIKLALTKKLSENDLNYLYNMFFYNKEKNEEAFKILVFDEQFRKRLSDDEIYIIEKYMYNLHQDELKNYEKYILNYINNYKISYIDNKILYKNSNFENIFIINKIENNITYIDIDLDFQDELKNKYKLTYYGYMWLIKYMFEKYLNLKNIKISIYYI